MSNPMEKKDESGAKPDSSLAVKDRKLAQLQRQMDDAVGASEFLPLMGAFQEYIETERRRSVRQMVGLSALFGVILVLFLAGPICLGVVFLRRAETAFSAERQSYREFNGAVQSGLASLTKATVELREALDVQKQLLQGPRREAGFSESVPYVPMVTNLSVAAAPAPSVAPERHAVEQGKGPGEAQAQDRLMQVVGEIEATIAAIDRQKNPARPADGSAVTGVSDNARGKLPDSKEEQTSKTGEPSVEK